MDSPSSLSNLECPSTPLEEQGRLDYFLHFISFPYPLLRFTLSFTSFRGRFVSVLAGRIEIVLHSIAIIFTLGGSAFEKTMLGCDYFGMI